MENTDALAIDTVGSPPRAVQWSSTITMYRGITFAVFVLSFFLSWFLMVDLGNAPTWQARHKSGPSFASTPNYASYVQNVPIVVGLIVACVAIVFELGYRREYRLLHDGILIQARVTSVRALAEYQRTYTLGGRDERYTYLDNSHTPDPGRETQVGATHEDVQSEFTTGGYRYSGGCFVPRPTHGWTQVGDEIEVLYHPKDPYDNKPFALITYVQIRSPFGMDR